MPARYQFSLFALMLLALAACRPPAVPAEGNRPAGTPAPATQAPAAAPSATAATAVAVTAPGATATMAVSPSACALTGGNFGNVVVAPASMRGWCEIRLPLEGYRVAGYGLFYPEGWTVRLAGAEAMNLAFNEGEDDPARWAVFVQVTPAELPLERAGEATYDYELSGPEPLVDPGETILQKEVRSIGEQQVLVLSSSQDDLAIRRYFLVHTWPYKGTLSAVYMLEVKAAQAEAGTPEYAQFLGLVERMVATVQFVR